MSAETFRCAAAKMRRRWKGDEGDTGKFHLAVADWLEGMASRVERDEWSNTYDLALAAARAYIGECAPRGLPCNPDVCICGRDCLGSVVS